MNDKVRAGCFISGLLLVLIVGAGFLRNVAPKFPAPPAPKPLPSPNAYDIYVKATTQLVGTTEVGEMVRTKPKQTWTLAEKQELLDDNKAALTIFRSGLAYEYADPPRILSAKTLFPEYAKFRSLGRVATLDGLVAAQKGEWNRAANAYLDVIQLGRQVPNRAAVIGGLVGLAIEAIGRKLLWDTIEHLSATESHAALNRLEAMEKQRATWADTLQTERYYVQAQLQELFDGKIDLGTGNSVQEKVIVNSCVLIYGKRNIMKNTNNGFDLLIANAEGAYPDSKPLPKTDILNEILLPIYPPGHTKSVTNIAFNTLLRTSLALRAYRLEHGSYPTDLNALVTTGYLKSVPADPFARNAPLGYQKNGAKYILYSIGPDGKDDKGKAIDNPNSTNRGAVQSDSKGDIVAGVNRY